MPDRDLAFDVADFFYDTGYADLSPEAVDGAKKSILDTFGVCLAASGKEPAVHAIVDMVQETGGKGESSLIAFGGKVPAVMAAFANGAMAHCLDYDDQTPWGQHSASSLLPAVYAISERVGGVTGEQMISAVAAGQDFFNRCRQHVDWKKDWMFSTVMGVFGAAAAGAKLLGLSREQIANAIGIASMQCSGLAEVVNSTGGDLRALYAGFPAKGAVLSAILAERGISGLPAVFEGPFGIMNQYFGGRYDRDKILEGLGQVYTGGLTLYKRWPAVGTAHSHIHATIGLMRENDLQVEDIAEIRVYVGDYHQLMCEPIDTRRVPQTLVDAKFSLPFLVSTAAVHREMRLANFTEEGIHDSRVLAAAQKVLPIVDSSLDWKLELPPGRVEIVMTDGRRFERVGTGIPGSVENPMTWGDIFAKFDDCARAAIHPWSTETIAGAQEMARNLEQVTDATALLRLA
ncbi:MmgE/PrpD family protein [Sphingomonas sp. AP4-R1]|uniref:MmgE/PrpD family protein n=1 Tax=Sphingomonas sp. AP4-R1 TaxID=2735134 RepID=UPI0014938DEE|nr:MmgE/PrpD family protein [Sphingomonas sp. AP4-R1]QJU58164.1 MmgE/PrpD family protein [Sphingomonas sp. AP4-R1]